MLGEQGAVIIESAHARASYWLDVPQFRDRRWQHVCAVAAKASSIASICDSDSSLLVASAWLHDVGYAPQVQRTGFHHLDGARALAAEGFGRRLCALVANHSAGSLEASMRGLAVEMAAYPDEKTKVRDALWACDMTTGPAGEPVSFEKRLRDIVERYGSEHSVALSITAGAEEIRAAIARTCQRVTAAGLAGGSLVNEFH